MTARAEIEVGSFNLPPLREIGLWAAAALFVLTAHIVIAHAIQALRPLDPPVEANEPALMIDLAPLAVSAPETVETETVSEVTPEETVEPIDDVPEIVEEKPESAETAELDETVEPETVEPQQAEPEVVEPEPTEPEIAEVVTPEVAVPLPEPRPVIKEPEKKQAERKVEPRKKAEKPAPKREVAKAEPKAEPRAKPAAKAPSSQKSKASRAPSISPAKWQSRVLAWLNRHKRYPRGARSRREEGVVSVSFAINASGDVISARVARSSGNSELDEAALDMLRRASPVPAPPPGVGRNIAVPVQFNLR
jgi:protein TonB